MTQVLVFEPDHAFAMELRTELSKLGCTVQVFSDGNPGLDAAAKQRPDLILLTVELPRVNGFSVCNKIKKDPVLRTVPLIILSAQSSPETFDQHRKLPQRAEDYVHKPIAFRDLLVRIQGFLAIGNDDDDEEMGIVDEVTSQVTLDELVIVEDPTGEMATLQTADFNAGMIGVEPPRKLQLDIPGPSSEVATDRMPLPAEPGPAAFALSFDDDEGETQLTPRPNAAEAALFAAHAGLKRPGQVVSPDEAPPVPAISEPAPPSAPASVPSAPGSFPAAPGSFPAAPDSVPGAAAPPAPGSIPEAAGTEPRHTAGGTVPAPPVEDFVRTHIAPPSARTAATRKSILEVERLHKELDAARKQLSKAQHNSSVSSDELLELRGKLQERDKELLRLREELSAKEREWRQQLGSVEGTLREQLNAKERELLDARDEMLTVERGAAELQQRLTHSEAQASEALTRIEALTADKALADKRALDFKTGAKKIAEQLNARGIELKDQREKYEQAHESQKTKHEHATRETEERHREQLAAAEAAHQQQLDKLAQEAELQVAQQLAKLQQDAGNKQVQFEELQKRHEAELKEKLDKSRQTVQAFEEQLEQLEKESADQLHQLEQSHAAALEQLAAQHAEELARATVASQAQLAELNATQQQNLAAIEGALEQAAADAQAKREQLRNEQQHQLETAEQENAAALQKAGKDFQDKLEAKEKAHIAIVDALEEENSELQVEHERLTGEVATLESQLAEVTSERDALDQRAADLDTASVELEVQTSTLTKERDGLEAIVVKHETRIAKLDVELKAAVTERDSLSAQLTQANSDLEHLGTERDTAVAQARERGETALAEAQAAAAKTLAEAEALAKKTLAQEREAAGKALTKEQLRLKKALNRWGREREALAKARQSLSAVVTQLASTEETAMDTDDAGDS